MAGKGDTSRVTDHARYREEYDRIFRKRRGVIKSMIKGAKSGKKKKN